MAIIQEKKKFFEIEVPFLKKEIEIYGKDKNFNGKHIKLDLTNLLKGKGMEINFLIQEENGKISVMPKKAYLHGFYIRRMLRSGTNYAEDSFLTKCKDYQIRIKPFLITRKKVSREVLKALREKAREKIIEYVKDKTFEANIKDIMEGKLQKEIIPILKKIYPLGLFEIKFIGIEETKKYEKYEEEQEKKQDIQEKIVENEEKFEENKKEDKSNDKEENKKKKTKTEKPKE